MELEDQVREILKEMKICIVDLKTAETPEEFHKAETKFNVYRDKMAALMSNFDEEDPIVNEVVFQIQEMVFNNHSSDKLH